MLLDLLSVTGNKKLSGSWTIAAVECLENNIILLFLAHLSRRFIGELIVYGGIRRPS